MPLALREARGGQSVHRACPPGAQSGRETEEVMPRMQDDR